MDKIISKKSSIIVIAVVLFVIVVSFFCVSKWASDPDSYEDTIKYIDNKKVVATGMVTASTAASVAISFLPGDAGSAISDKLADLSGYLIVILSALFLSKYLLTLSGILLFKIAIPISSLLFLGAHFCHDTKWAMKLRAIIPKILILALVLWVSVPISVNIGNLIDDTYNLSIDKMIQDANDKANEIQEAADSSDDNAIMKFLKKIKGGANYYIDRFQIILTSFIEGIAVMIVTTCLIPIATILILLWALKLFIGVNIVIPRGRIISKGIKSGRRRLHNNSTKIED